MKPLHKTNWFLILSLLTCVQAFGLPISLRQATQAEVNSGANVKAFVGPSQLANFPFVATNLPLSTLSNVVDSHITGSAASGTNFLTVGGLSQFFPRIDIGRGLVGYAGPGHLTNTLADGFTNLNTWENIVWNTNGAGIQLEVIWVQNGSNIWVHEPVQNTLPGGGYYVNSNSTWVIYRNSANLYDVNTNTADYTGHTHGAIASDGGIGVSTGGQAGVTGWSYGYRLADKTNSWRIAAEALGSDPVLNFEVGGGGQSGNPFTIYWNSLYETLDVLPGGLVGVRTGFTNKFGPLMQFVSTTNQFGDGTQAILRGPDSNFQLVMRENGNRYNDYYAFGDSYSNGGGHRFTTRGFGADKTEFVVAIDYVYSGVPFMLESTNFSSIDIAPSGNQVLVINSNKVLYAVSATKTNLLLDVR